MTLQDAKEYLDSFINFEIHLQDVPPSFFKLNRVEKLLDLIDHPEKRIPCVHVAGSKGKGSTCAFVAHILGSAGYRVGLYTSPHLESVQERIRIVGEEERLSDAAFVGGLETLRPQLEMMRSTKDFGRLSYFEVLTVLAFYYFAEQQVDFAVIETGLGGRLDATNVIDSLVCGITPIRLEHTKILGNTLAEIAREKAAIIKSDQQTVVVAPQEPEVFDVVRERCMETGARMYSVGKDISCQESTCGLSGHEFDVQGLLHRYQLKTVLLGFYQMLNATMAVGLTEALSLKGVSLKKENVEQGVALTRWPGRFEIIQKDPYIVLDCAHDVYSCAQLALTIRKIFPGRNVTLILGVSQDKDRAGIIQQFKSIAKRFIFTQAQHPRAYIWGDEDALFVSRDQDCVIRRRVSEAAGHALNDASRVDVIVITGSVFVVGEAKEYFNNGTAYRVPRTA